MDFFTTSWKDNAFNKRNFVTCQTIQLVLTSLQLYFALIVATEGGIPTQLTVAIFFMICSGIYSYFSPSKLTAVNAMQSNGAQLAVVGLSAASILAYNPGLPFMCLFSMIALDLFLSVTTFFGEQRMRIVKDSSQAVSFLTHTNERE
jgi:hypothetical protein